MDKFPVGFRYKYTGFHYNEGGWKLYYQHEYEDRTLGEWIQLEEIFVDRFAAEKMGKYMQESFIIDMYRKLNG